MTKDKRNKIILVFVIVGSLYGFISAIRNQNPYYPAVGTEVESEEQISRAWHWEPSAYWAPSYLLCIFPRNGFGISHTRSGYCFHSQIDRVLYFTGSILLGGVFGFVAGAIKLVKYKPLQNKMLNRWRTLGLSIKGRQMKHILTRKVICVLFAVTALVVLAFVIRAAVQYPVPDSLESWIGVLFPVFLPLLSAFISIRLYPDFNGKHPVRRAILWGVFAGINGVVVIMAFNLFSRYQLITADGTAFWGLVFVPCFWIGLPSVIVGALLGWITGLILNRKNKSE